MCGVYTRAHTRTHTPINISKINSAVEPRTWFGLLHIRGVHALAAHSHIRQLHMCVFVVLKPRVLKINPTICT